MKKLRVILSGGGTGGHFYPAVAVAEALIMRMGDDVGILFVGALGKMEMQKVPALGYRIEGLPVAGMQRSLSAKNLLLPFKVIKSVMRARSIIKRFQADIVVGFGGYASAPVLWAAQGMGIPTIIQEQNSYAGVTNKILGAKAKKICVAYDKMERFFPSESIILTGNPLRGNFAQSNETLRAEGLKYFGFDGTRPVVLIVGGSLGTRTLNNAMKHWADTLTAERKVDVIWQTGAYYRAEMDEFMSSRSNDGIWHGAFIERMDLAYAVADVVVSRSGACTVSELCLTGKPVIFVPSPNVAEDHQTKNAMALVEKGAAMMIADSEAVEKVIPMAIETATDSARLKELSEKISALAIADSAERVVNEIEALTISSNGK